MTQFDAARENDSTDSSDSRPHEPSSSPGEAIGAPANAALPGDPITYAASAGHASSESKLPLPEFLRAPWSWGHFLMFVFFTFVSFIVVQTALALHYAPQQKLSKEQYEHYFMSNSHFVVGSTIICSALIFLFLYVTISVLRDLPFWSTLGWRPLQRDTEGRKRNPLTYFFFGFALAIFVGLAGSQVHTKEGIPLQELFKNRETALVFMAMAVLVAPLVEETVFR